MIDTFNQSSKYLMSFVIAHGRDLKRKTVYFFCFFLLWNERNNKMGGREELYLVLFLVGKENNIC